MRSMARQSREDRRLDAIRSVSIEDIVYGRHTRWRRFLRRAKKATSVVSALAAATAVGSAVYFVLSRPGEVLLTSKPPASSASAPQISEPLDVPPLSAIATAGDPVPMVHPAPMGAPVNTATPFEMATLSNDATVDIPSAEVTPNRRAEVQVDPGRLPTPRPDEPIVTGSIARADADPRETRRFRPCRTLQRWTSHLPLPRIHCGG
jgi:hypothetical protein